MSEKKFIDIEKLIASKSPKALKWIPKFVIRYLKRILHQDEINQFLWDNRDKKNLEFCEAVVDFLDIEMEIKHLERVPSDGKVVLAMNHPLGGMDAMILVTALKGRREDLKFIVNDLLMNLENINDYFIGVNKHGKSGNNVRAQIRELFQSDNAVCIFPAGLVSRKQDGEIRDLEWKKTFVTYSKQYDRTIIPIYIDGGLSKFFYRLAKFRKFLRIKTNLEMLYLVDELFKQRGKRLKFIVGEPVQKDVLAQDKTDRAIAQDIKEIVYNLQSEV